MNSTDIGSKASVMSDVKNEERLGISVSDVTVTYRNGYTALYDANFTVPQGSVTALVGVNGAGKSTLFKAIMGFVPMSKGQIQILGESVKKALKSNMVSYVPQSEEIDWNFPVLVEEVVMMGRYGHMNWLRRPKDVDHLAVDLALERVNMLELRKRQIGELSGGQKKRVFLARALAQEAKVILLDEPFTGVDVKTEHQIIDLLKSLRDEGHVMLVSTHNLGSVPEFCDRTIMVNKTVLASGPIETTYTEENLQRVFGGSLRHFKLGGNALHHDEDTRELTILTDDERPFIQYDGKALTAKKTEPQL